MSFGATICDDWIYIYGGSVGKAHEFNRACTKGDGYRMQAKPGANWEPLPDGQSLLGATLVASEGKVIRIGGMTAHNEKGAKNDLYSTNEAASLDLASRTWQPLPPLPEPRSSHDAIIFNGKVYVGGGWLLSGDDGEEAHATRHHTLLTLDLAAPGDGWKSIPQPFERRALAMAAYQGRIWFIGGMDNQNTQVLTVDWFEPSTQTWGKGPDLPQGPMAGVGVAACEANGKLYASPYSGKVLTLSEDGTQWRETTALHASRFFHRLLPARDGGIIAVGGSNRQGALMDLEVISPSSSSEQPNTTLSTADSAKN